MVACSLSFLWRISTEGSEQSELAPLRTVCLVPRAARSDGSCTGCSPAVPPQRTQKTQVGHPAAALASDGRAALHAGGMVQCPCRPNHGIDWRASRGTANFLAATIWIIVVPHDLPLSNSRPPMLRHHVRGRACAPAPARLNAP